MIGAGQQYNATINIGDLYAIPLWVSGSPLRLGGIGCVVSSGVGVARMAIYDSLPNGYPNEFQGVGGSFSITAAGLNSREIDLTLDPGLYWLTLVTDASIDPQDPGVGLDGQNDYIGIPSGALQQTNNFTFEVWAKGGTTLPKDTSIAWAHQSNNTRTLNIHLPWSDSKVVFDCGSPIDGGASSYDRIEKVATSAEIKGSWRHWAFTKDGPAGEMKIYLDGGLWHEDTVTGWPMPVSTLFQLGAEFGPNGSRNFWHGRLRDVRIWNVTRTASQIAAAMNGITGSEIGLTHWYPVDEGEGDQIMDDGPGPTMHGTLYGPNWGSGGVPTFMRQYDHAWWPHVPLSSQTSGAGNGLYVAGHGQGIPAFFPSGAVPSGDVPKIVYQVMAA